MSFFLASSDALFISSKISLLIGTDTSLETVILLQQVLALVCLKAYKVMQNIDNSFNILYNYKKFLIF